MKVRSTLPPVKDISLDAKTVSTVSTHHSAQPTHLTNLRIPTIHLLLSNPDHPDSSSHLSMAKPGQPWLPTSIHHQVNQNLSLACMDMVALPPSFHPQSQLLRHLLRLHHKLTSALPTLTPSQSSQRLPAFKPDRSLPWNLLSWHRVSSLPINYLSSNNKRASCPAWASDWTRLKLNPKFPHPPTSLPPSTRQSLRESPSSCTS